MAELKDNILEDGWLRQQAMQHRAVDIGSGFTDGKKQFCWRLQERSITYIQDATELNIAYSCLSLVLTKIIIHILGKFALYKLK